MDDILQQKINEHGSLQAYYAWLDRPNTHTGDELDDALEWRLEQQAIEMERSAEEEIREHPEWLEPADDPVEPAPETPTVEFRNASEDDDLPDFLRPNFQQKK